MIESLIEAMNRAIKTLEETGKKEIVLFHHNDTDGLSSGSLLFDAFVKCGFTVERFSLEKPYPQVLEKIFQKQNRVIVFADFAGKIAPLISELNRKENLVIILDHHPAIDTEDETVLNLDGMLHGLKGDRDISASATAYLFAKLLMDKTGISSSPLSHLGVLGAIGDGFLVEGALAGYNRTVLEEAVKDGLVRVERNEQGEKYFLSLGGREYSALDICSVLDTLGGVAYYSDGVERGIDVCLNGLDDETDAYAKSLREKQDILFNNEIKKLKMNIHTTDHIQWFDLKDRFKPMGVKMVGVFCTMVKDMDFLDNTKYLAGFQVVPDEVPGFGSISFGSTKVSMRVSQLMTDKIRSGDAPGLSSILPDATEVIGGFSDACHSLSAATTVSIGQEKILIDEMENILNRGN